MGKQLIVGAYDSMLAQKAAHALGYEFSPYSIARFSDTESKIQFKKAQDFVGSAVLVFFQFYSQMRPCKTLNDQLFDLLLIIQQLKQFHVQKISLVLPYLPYARQEKDIDQYSISSTTLFGTLLQRVGVDEIISCDIHALTILSIMPISVKNIALAPVWQGLCKDFLKNTILVSPDEGGRNRVAALASLTDTPTAFIKKERVAGDAKALELVGDVAGKTVILLDDIVDTAQTALGAYDLLIKSGAVRVTACFSHAVLSGDAYHRLLKSDLEHIFITDSLLFDALGFDKKFTVVSLHDVLIENLTGHPELVSGSGSLKRVL